MENSQKWEVGFTVDPHDVDFNGCLRASLMLRYLQEANSLQHRTLGPDLEMLRSERKIAFILSKVQLKCFASAKPYAPLTARVWYAGGLGYRFLRSGELYSEGKKLAEMHSVWALTDISDPQNRKLLRADSLPLGFGMEAPLDLGFAPRMRFPEEEAITEEGTFPVLYGLCDRNRHMNNTNYPDMFCGFAGDMTGKRVSELEISYVTEAPLGETLTVLRAEKGEDFFFRSVRRDGKTNAEARLRLTAIE